MKRAIPWCVLVVAACSAHVVAEDNAGYVALKDTPISLLPPTDFAPAGDGRTFHHKSKNASIEVTHLDAPYAEVMNVFTVEEMAKRGMRLLSKDNVSVGGRAALLLNVSENTADAAIFRWTLVLGDYQETCLLSGTYPKDAENELSAPLRSAVLSAHWNKRAGAEAFANFRFSVEPAPTLTFTKQTDISTLVVFTKDGVFPLNGPGDPLFLVGYELNPEKITNEREFAQQALKKVPHCTEVVQKDLTSITLGGLRGFECLADAKDESSGTPLKVYQTLLFAEGYHVFMLGIVDVPRAEAMLPDFKATARTFQLKQE